MYTKQSSPKKKKKIDYTIKNIEGKDYLQYEWIDIEKIDEYPIVTKVIKGILKQEEFPVHSINNDMKKE